MTRRLFTAAALFNWVVALGLFLIPGVFLGLFAVTPAPEQTLWTQQFAGLVFIFGIGYYQASKDLATLAPVIRLAVWGKWGVVAIAALNVLTGDISWQFLIPASADGVFAILFTLALRSLPGK
ncbi:hypothetical protein DWB85_14185 [Seongchinamella sediminis]|uniref:Uncharacterized protein n=2 Tax=Seongchinamella sediminis TaxID=2283635 RepID=A0A3L7DUH1_9GAMM|nr:hypothetical protein DWB85_14185 [Seongchinamella sediminis]